LANDLAGNIYVTGAFAGGVEALDGTLAAITGIFERDYGGELIANLPAITFTGSEKLNTSGTFVVTLPAITADFLSGGYLDVTLPAITGEITYDFNTSGSFACTLPMIQFAMTGLSGVLGTLDAVIPALTFSGSGYSYGTNTLAGTIPAITFMGTGTGGTYTCVVINLLNGAVTTYTNFSFDSFVKVGDAIYGVNSAGIYLLGGDTDITTDISASFQTFLTDYGMNNDKNLADCVIGLRSDGQVTVESIYSDATGRSAIIASTSDIMTDKRVSLGRKGTASRFVGNKVTNVSGADFSVDSIYQEILIHKRGKRINE